MCGPHHWWVKSPAPTRPPWLLSWLEQVDVLLFPPASAGLQAVRFPLDLWVAVKVLWQSSSGRCLYCWVGVEVMFSGGLCNDTAGGAQGSLLPEGHEVKLPYLTFFHIILVAKVVTLHYSLVRMTIWAPTWPIASLSGNNCLAEAEKLLSQSALSGWPAHLARGKHPPFVRVSFCCCFGVSVLFCPLALPGCWLLPAQV